jgi:hypothetical protein
MATVGCQTQTAGPPPALTFDRTTVSQIATDPPSHVERNGQPVHLLEEIANIGPDIAQQAGAYFRSWA